MPETEAEWQAAYRERFASDADHECHIGVDGGWTVHLTRDGEPDAWGGHTLWWSASFDGESVMQGASSVPPYATPTNCAAFVAEKVLERVYGVSATVIDLGSSPFA